jgi:hypothetical protein
LTFGAQLVTVSAYSSEFNSHCSVTMWNSRTNYNIAGEYVTVQNCSLNRGEDV